MRQSEAARAISAWRSSGAGIAVSSHATVEQGRLVASGGLRQMRCCAACLDAILQARCGTGAHTWSTGSAAAGCERHATQLSEEQRCVAKLVQAKGTGRAMLAIVERPTELAWHARDGVAQEAHV
jgi:hypothetical protein